MTCPDFVHLLHKDSGASLTLDAKAIEERLHEVGYLAGKAFEDGRWAAIRHMLNGVAITRGNLDNREETMWFYKNYQTAVDVLNAWDGSGNPPNFTGTFKLHGLKDRAWDHRVA